MRNTFSGIDSLWSVDGGAGFKLLDGPSQFLKAEGGAGWTNEKDIIPAVINGQPINNITSRDYANVRAALNYKWQFTKSAAFTNDFSYLLDLDNTKNYFIANKAAITADISKIFALQAHGLSCGATSRCPRSATPTRRRPSASWRASRSRALRASGRSRALAAELLGFAFEARLQGLSFCNPLGGRELADVLADLHRAELRAAHRAEVGGLGASSGRSRRGTRAVSGSSAEVELVFPAELEAGAGWRRPSRARAGWPLARSAAWAASL